MSTSHATEAIPDPQDTAPTAPTQDEAPGLKPESSADAEGNSDGTPADAPTSDDGYEDKPESTEEAEGGESIDNG